MKWWLVVLLALIAIASTGDSLVNPNLEDDDEHAYKQRIIGGKTVKIRRYPHQASLRIDAKPNHIHHICGASIISVRHCLTAAHCHKKGTAPEQYSVLVGTVDNKRRDRAAFETRVRRFIVHPKYKYESAGHPHDIAVLLLEKSLPINGKTIAVIRMPRSNAAVPFGKHGVVSGWGLTEDNSAPDLLKAVKIRIRSNEECHRHFLSFVPEKSLCAGSVNHRKGSCKGDSGGPFIVHSKLWGVVSYGRHGCMGTSVYSNVAYYRDWIQNNMVSTRELD